MSKGIYKYTDLKTGEIVYIGKDSNIDKNERYKAHLRPSTYNKQPFNRVLQNNPDRYEYGVIWATEDCTDLKLNKMEILFGKIYNPKFNFDKFGKGGCKRHTKETKQKISKNNAKYWKGKNLPEETKQKISESNKGREAWNKGILMFDKTKRKISETKKNKYATIHKAGFVKEKQIYALRFGGKVLKKSYYLYKLLNWFSENYPCEILKIPKKEDL